MKKARLLSKLLIPALVILLYSVALYKTATAPTAGMAVEGLQTASIAVTKSIPVKAASVEAALDPEPVGEVAASIASPAAAGLVVVLEIEDTNRAYALSDFEDEFAVINDTINKVPVVIFMDSQNQRAMAYIAEANGQQFVFSYDGKNITDLSGSQWSINGRAISGSLADTRLEPLPTLLIDWSDWVAKHPQTSLYGR
ncbi:MAG: DUF3179 domain-containing protein [Anaerolineales bacterium]|nr:DUF3179 domain-containing protein [Anaerolineales bacterium]